MISLQSRKILVIKSNDVYFGLNIDLMKEIFQTQKIVKLPRASVSLAGVVNLRGKIVTVFDLKVMLWGKNSTKDQEQDKKYVLLVNYRGKEIGILVENIPQMINVDEIKDISSSKMRKLGLKTHEAIKNEVKSKEFEETIFHLDVEALLSKFIDHSGSSLSSEEDLIKTNASDEMDDIDDFDYDQFTLPE
ncbi:MAG: chemotaxis protein CheW [Candidatus Hodarchaeales archaeon]